MGWFRKQNRYWIKVSEDRMVNMACAVSFEKSGNHVKIRFCDGSIQQMYHESTDKCFENLENIIKWR